MPLHSRNTQSNSKIMQWWASNGYLNSTHQGSIHISSVIPCFHEDSFGQKPLRRFPATVMYAHDLQRQQQSRMHVICNGIEDHACVWPANLIEGPSTILKDWKGKQACSAGSHGENEEFCAFICCIQKSEQDQVLRVCLQQGTEEIKTAYLWEDNLPVGRQLTCNKVTYLHQVIIEPWDIKKALKLPVNTNLISASWPSDHICLRR